jgi:rare lipoprotein A
MKHSWKISLIGLFLLIVLGGFSTKNNATLFSFGKTIDTVKTVTEVNDSVQYKGNFKFVLLRKGAHASYYADKFNGRKTASGELFNNQKYTAAHRTLPFGTKVRITNEANGKSTVVKINDRGPFVKGRHIDLSKSAFREIALHHGYGSIKVTIELVEEMKDSL